MATAAHLAHPAAEAVSLGIFPDFLLTKSCHFADKQLKYCFAEHRVQVLFYQTAAPRYLCGQRAGSLIVREEDVFAGVSRGVRNEEIAGEKAVKRYMTRITRKLQV